MINHKALFLKQSYSDSYENYKKSFDPEITTWDYVVLTASNEKQAEGYREQIDYRLKTGFLTNRTKYVVISDKNGKRIGSGGATLQVLKYISEKESLSDFSSLRILCIHSGGDSKRIPQYSVCGKIFSAVPRVLPCGRCSTLFDEVIIGTSGMPGRMSDGGMLVYSGDVLLLFNSLQFDFYGDYAAALTIKENALLGQNHGVFVGNENGYVKKCLQKQPIETLKANGAVDRHGNVNIDTGAVVFSGKMLNLLYKLVEDKRKYDLILNEKNALSFYVDFLYPLASDSTLEGFYKEKGECEFSETLASIRRELWELLHGITLKLINFSPASFIHFGTTHEMLTLFAEQIADYGYLGWDRISNSNYRKENCAVYNSYISKNSSIGDGAYIEDSLIGENVVVGDRSVVSGVSLENITIPSNVVIHCVKLQNGLFVCRMYGVDDNPKLPVRMGENLCEPLWTAPLFPVKETVDEAIRSALKGEKDGSCLSLKESFENADTLAMLHWRNNLKEKIIIESILESIDEKISMDKILEKYSSEDFKEVEKNLISIADGIQVKSVSDFSRKTRIYYLAYRMFKNKNYYKKCYATISEEVILAENNDSKYKPTQFDLTKNYVVVNLPVRVNFGGGWSDTPPYCNENGATVINAAIKLNDSLPVEVSIKRTESFSVVLSSSDIGVRNEFNEIEELRSCDNPNDPFALHKAALMACGIIPSAKSGDTLIDVCKRLRGGIWLNTRVIGIPKGSGLGTSSILASACVKAIYDFLGVNITKEEIYSKVLCMEQLMSTGGGWQDQVGGLSKGFKMITTQCGLRQKITCETLSLSEDAVKELNDRYVLIYTGQRRLARNLLRDVVGSYISSNPETVHALYSIQQIAALMRFELLRGNIDAFGNLFNEHWDLSRKIDSECSNTCIDQIIVAINDLIVGKMICGAGGGGFLQVILKKGITKTMLSERLENIFADSGVKVYDSEFYI